MHRIQRNHRTPQRTGAAAVEFALIIPIFLILTFGTLEICSAIFLKEVVTIAAHEGARVAIKKTSTSNEAIATVRNYLTSRGINVSALPSNAIQVTPQAEQCLKLTPISVTVTVPVAGNCLLPNSFYTWVSGQSVQTSVAMYKEYTHPVYEATLAGGT